MQETEYSSRLTHTHELHQEVPSLLKHEGCEGARHVEELEVKTP